MRIRVYIDGFNLYFGCLKDTPYRWLNCETLCREMLRKEPKPWADCEIVGMKYFTTILKKLPGDRGSKTENQRIYLRALATLDNLEIIYGFFQRKEVKPRMPGRAREFRWNEKGSDVNLAAHLLNDAHKANRPCVKPEEKFDAAVVVSGDTDFAGAIGLAVKDAGVKVWVFSPRPSRIKLDTLHESASFVRDIRADILARSQFPARMQDTQGRRIHMPQGWDKHQDEDSPRRNRRAPALV